MTTRKITGDNYAATCAELICAFGAAIEATRMDRPDQDVVQTAALELAASCGWDWQADEAWLSWAHRATAEESLVEGLQKTLTAVNVRRAANAMKGAWNGFCPSGKHGLDYQGQRCDLCAKEQP